MVPRTGRLGPGTVEKSCLVGRVKIHRARVIRKEGKKYKEEHVLKTTKYGSGGSVMLWDCFCAGSFGPLATLNGRVNQDKYIKCFAEVYVFWMVDLMEKEQKSFILQDDEASCHTAGKPSACSKADQPEVNSFAFWPAQSPNLNPIEHLWAIPEKRIQGRTHHIHNTEQLQYLLVSKMNGRS